jgi:hypothetical protein
LGWERCTRAFVSVRVLPLSQASMDRRLRVLCCALQAVESARLEEEAKRLEDERAAYEPVLGMRRINLDQVHEQTDAIVEVCTQSAR